MKSKACRQCGKVQPLSGFWKDPRTADGTKNTCRRCKRTGTNARRKGSAARVACLSCGGELRYCSDFCHHCVNSARRAICVVLGDRPREADDIARRVEIRNRSARGLRCD